MTKILIKDKISKQAFVETIKSCQAFYKNIDDLYKFGVDLTSLIDEIGIALDRLLSCVLPDFASDIIYDDWLFTKHEKPNTTLFFDDRIVLIESLEDLYDWFCKLEADGEKGIQELLDIELEDYDNEN